MQNASSVKNRTISPNTDPKNSIETKMTNSNPRDEKDNEKPLVMMQDNRKRYQNRKEKSERNRKKTENGDVGEKDSKDESYLNYKNKTNRGYNRGRYKRENNDKEREHFEKLTQNFIRGGKP